MLQKAVYVAHLTVFRPQIVISWQSGIKKNAPMEEEQLNLGSGEHKNTTMQGFVGSSGIIANRR